MTKKTVLTQLLRKWGIMTTELQTAYESDQAILMNDEKIYIDNPNNNTVVPENNSIVPERTITTANKKEIKEKEILNRAKEIHESIMHEPSMFKFNFEEQQEIIDNLDLD